MYDDPEGPECTSLKAKAARCQNLVAGCYKSVHRDPRLSIADESGPALASLVSRPIFTATLASLVVFKT